MSFQHPTVRLVALTATVAAVVVACDKAPTEQTVTVYSSRSHYGAESVFVAFTRSTGIKVEFFDGNNNEVLERLKTEGERTNADLLLTVDAGNLWNAAEQGLLQPVESTILTANVPAHLRDPANQWFAIATRVRTLMVNPARVQTSELSTYEALGDPKWKGRLCLRTSSAIYNQSLLASLIAIHGEEAAERIVRGWIANDPIYINGDTQILEAIAAGRCDVGITNHYYLARLLAKDPALSVAPFWADQAGAGVHVNISGGGVTRHAKNRAAAIKLLEYLTSPEAQGLLASSTYEFPANPAVEPHDLLARFGPFKAQSVGVAAAGANQAAAVRLADRANYR